MSSDHFPEETFKAVEEGDGNPADQERPETRGVGDNVREDGALVVDVDGLLGGKPGDGEQTGTYDNVCTAVLAGVWGLMHCYFVGVGAKSYFNSGTNLRDSNLRDCGKSSKFVVVEAPSPARGLPIPKADGSTS